MLIWLHKRSCLWLRKSQACYDAPSLDTGKGDQLLRRPLWQLVLAMRVFDHCQLVNIWKHLEVKNQNPKLLIEEVHSTYVKLRLAFVCINDLD